MTGQQWDEPLPPDYQRLPPYERLTPRRALVIRPEQIQPVIRIAHRKLGAVRIHDRVIVDHELVLFRRAAGTLRIGDDPLPLSDGLLVYLPAFVPHQILCEHEPETEHLAVHFDYAPDLPQSEPDLASRTPYQIHIAQCPGIPTTLPAPAGGSLDRALLRIVECRQSPDPLARAEASAELALVLLRLLRTGQADSEPTDEWQQARMQRVAAWLDDHYAEAVQVADLAQLAGLSPSHFSRLFHKWAGYSPMEYLKRTRIEQARRLLADTDLTVKEIAASVGYPDPYHFSRVFRQLDGLSASQYRAAARMQTGGRTRETDRE